MELAVIKQTKLTVKVWKAKTEVMAHVTGAEIEFWRTTVELK